MAAVRRCPKCNEPLRSTRHRKLRCPKCKTVYPLTPDPPDLLTLPAFKWARRIRWASLGIATLIVVLSSNFFTNGVGVAATNFWMNIALVITYATVAYGFLHWFMYTRAMERTLWAGTHLGDFSRRERRKFVAWIVACSALATGTMIALLHDSIGQAAALNVIVLVAACFLHLAVQFWNQHAAPIFDGVTTVLAVDALKKRFRRKKAQIPVRRADR